MNSILRKNNIEILTLYRLDSINDNQRANDDNYISKTLKDGVVNAFYDNAVVGNSYASFKKIDLNNLDRNDLDSLNKLTRNTIFSNVYEPGSTFKIITSAMNIEENLKGNKNAFSTQHIFNSSRYL